MIIKTAILIALLGLFLDFKGYGRISKCCTTKLSKLAYIAVAAFSYLLVMLVPVIMYFCISEENSAFMMKFSMGMLTAFLALFLPRQLFNIMLLMSKNRVWMWTSVVASVLLSIMFFYSISVTRTDYNIKEVKLHYDNLPAGFDGYRVAFISDIHIGTMLDAENELEDIFRMVNEAGVDAVLFGGDMVNVHHSEVDDKIMTLFSRLNARDGVFMVLGNHDTGAYMKNSTEVSRMLNMDSLEQKMQRAGWVVLRDSTVYIHKGGDSISITGIDYGEELLKYKHSLDAVNCVDFAHIYNNVGDSVFNITVSHLPQLWHSISDRGYSDLVLSGHIHAMQMKFFSLSPAQLIYNEWSGLYENEKGKLYINDGIGCVGYLARIGARPEITVIELHRRE